MKHRLSEFRFLAGLVLILSLCQCEKSQQQPVVVVESEPSVEALIDTVLDNSSGFKNIPLAEVMKASSGFSVVPLDPSGRSDSLLLNEIERIMQEMLTEWNAEPSTVEWGRRIGEVSERFEGEFLARLARAPGFHCDHSRNRQGKRERTGYPDLRAVEQESGQVFYISLKLVEIDAFQSSLQTFFFTPRGQSGRILEDACHLLIGLAHDGNNGAWKFPEWRLVDLSRVHVQMKAEFQADNRKLYSTDAIVTSKTID